MVRATFQVPPDVAFWGLGYGGDAPLEKRARVGGRDGGGGGV
jgi:hypothetical protein